MTRTSVRTGESGQQPPVDFWLLTKRPMSCAAERSEMLDVFGTAVKRMKRAFACQKTERVRA